MGALLMVVVLTGMFWVHGLIVSIQCSYAALNLFSDLLSYEEEHGRFPIAGGFSTTEDTMFATTLENGLVRALMDEGRKRTLAYYFKSAGAPNQAGIWQEGANFALNDPWGRPLQVFFDTNGDKRLRIPSRDGTFREVLGPVAVVCLGRDGILGSPPSKRCDDTVFGFQTPDPQDPLP